MISDIELSEIERTVFDLIRGRRKDDPITNAQLSSIVKADRSFAGYAMRQIIHRLRLAELPVCASGNGYYMAVTPEELNEYIDDLNARALGIMDAVSGLRRAHKNLPPPTPVQGGLQL